MKVKIKDGGIYRTIEIDSADYGVYVQKGYTKVIEEPVKIEKPVEIPVDVKVEITEPVKDEIPVEEPIIKEPVIEEKTTVLPKSKKKK